MSDRLVSIGELTALFKVSKSKARKISNKKSFPGAVQTLRMGAIWDLDEVLAWARCNDRKVHVDALAEDFPGVDLSRHVDAGREYSVMRPSRIELAFVHREDLPDGQNLDDAVFVDPKSPLAARQAVEQLGLYFKRETGWDRVYDAEGTHAVAVLLPANASVADGGVYGGVICVDPAVQVSAGREPIPVVIWYWVHPFQRRRHAVGFFGPKPSLVEQHWPSLIARWPNLAIAGPFTPAGLRLAGKLGVPIYPAGV